MRKLLVSDCIGTGYLFHRGRKSALGFIYDVEFVDNNLKPRLILTRVEWLMILKLAHVTRVQLNPQLLNQLYIQTDILLGEVFNDTLHHKLHLLPFFLYRGVIYYINLRWFSSKIASFSLIFVHIDLLNIETHLISRKKKKPNVRKFLKCLQVWILSNCLITTSSCLFSR